MRKELYDRLSKMDVEVHRFANILSIKAPTWAVSEKVTLADLADAFDDDEEAALRDYASVPSTTIHPFFKNPGILTKNADPDRRKTISDLLEIADWWSPDPLVSYFFAQDLSVTLDSTGIAMGHYDYDRECVVLDFTLRIQTSHAEPIDYSLIIDLIYSLTARGARIKKVLFDQFQSHYSITELKKKGYEAEVVTYADSLSGCITTHDLIDHNRLVYGLCDDIFIGEATELQVVNSKRIDHLQSEGEFNSKDVWDAAVNVVGEALREKAARAEKMDFIFNTTAINDALSHGLLHLDFARPFETITGIGWSRGETVITTVLRAENTIDVILAKRLPTSSVTNELVHYLRSIQEEIAPTAIITCREREFCVVELQQHGFNIRGLDLKKIFSTSLLENLSRLLLYRRLRITSSLSDIFLAPLNNFHRDETGRPAEEGHAAISSLAMALAPFPVTQTFPGDYGDVGPGDTPAEPDKEVTLI